MQLATNKKEKSNVIVNYNGQSKTMLKIADVHSVKNAA